MSSVPTSPRRSPYQGLIPYNEGDAPFFFGREKETRLIIANLFAAPLTLVYGASGVGKSSVLRAGVVHELRQRDDLAVVFFNSWQSSSIGGLIDAIGMDARRAGTARHKTPTIMSSVPPAGRLSLSEYLAALYDGRRFMILLDQFEEYFLYPQEQDFEEEFAQAVLQTEMPVSFLISVREDSLAKLDRFEGHIPSLFDNYLRIDHLNREAGSEAITKPIGQYNHDFLKGKPPFDVEPKLVEEVLNQVETGQVSLGETGRGMLKKEATQAQIETPFLQMVMMRLWNEEVNTGSRMLRLETLTRLANEETGETGAERIVRTHLDEKMDALAADRQDIAAAIFHYLVTPSGAKIAHTVDDLAEYANLPASELEPMLESLAVGVSRILRGVSGVADKPKDIRYEIYHDALAAPILDWRTRHMRAREQEEADRIAKANAWEAARLAETKAREDEQAKSAKRRRWFTAVLAVMFVIALMFLSFALYQSRAARTAAREAEKALAEAERDRKIVIEKSLQVTAQAEVLREAKEDAERDRRTAIEQTKLANDQSKRAIASAARATKDKGFAERVINDLKTTVDQDVNTAELNYRSAADLADQEKFKCEGRAAFQVNLTEFETLKRKYGALPGVTKRTENRIRDIRKELKKLESVSCP